MLLRKIYSSLLLGAMTLLMPGCLSEFEDTSKVQNVQPTAQFEVLSVVSHQSGQVINLSLDLVQTGEDLRSLQAKENPTTGAIDLISVGASEEMHLYLYKEGEAASLSTATVTWQGRTQTSIKLNKIQVNLAEGYSFNPGDKWLVAGVLGGKLDKTSKKVQMGTPRNGTGYNKLELGGMIDMPYALTWQRLDIPQANNASIPQTSLQPLGTLLRLHFYNNMLEDYQASELHLETNALRPTGVFDPTVDISLGKLPSWQAEEADSDTALSWIYQLGNATNPVVLQAGQGYSSEQTLYLWGMPTAIAEDKTATSIKLNVAPSIQPNDRSLQTTYQKQQHRVLKSGNSYRLSNLLTSDLLISELYYQFVKANQDPSNKSQQNYSIVEIYNPTASEIDLSDYALARLTFGGLAFSNQYVYTTQGDLADMRLLDPSRAQMLALSTVTGTTNDLTGFSTRMGTYDAQPRYRSVLGTPSLKIKPGQTILLGADGYIGGIPQPGKNIASFNTALSISPSTVDNPTDVQAIEKHYHPRAGMQIDSAIRAGYAQFMVALDNSRYIKTAPSNTSGAGVLLMDNADGIALFKRSYDSKLERKLILVDVTSPIGNATASLEYRKKILSEYNQVAKTPISALVSQDQLSYSIVRTNRSSFPKSQYTPEDWRVAVSENDGVKSLGTRHYVAGLSPFAPNYTGYKSSNNPKNLPFWGNRSYTPPSKQWTSIPTSGQNSFSDGISNVTESFTAISIASATATEQQINNPIGSSYDKNWSTFYHSKNSGENPAFPITLTYNFAQAETLSHIVYHPRNYNGSFTRVEITVTYEDGSQALVLDTNLGSPTTATQITWPGIESRKLRTVAFKAHRTAGNVLAVMEMEFFKRTENYVDPTSIFTDLLCTELRSNITYEEIMAIPDGFYRNLARQIYQGTYPREFRIAEYKSYPHPDRQQHLNRTQFAYSLYDNPTGIEVNSGERIVVWVDNPGGRTLSLAVQDMYKTPSYQEHRTIYPLKHGINFITPDRSGLTYILYHSQDTERGTLPSVRVHIAGGKVNGYYDSTNPRHQGRWAELLLKATGPHFDVLSEHTHLIYPTNLFRSEVKDPSTLLAMYDKIVVSEWELMGLVKYGRTFKNRMECRVVYDTNYHMYAITNRTGYNISSMRHMMNPALLRTSPWGPAHEMGHMNQTIGLNWGGMIEITVNIFASYLQFAVLGNDFRGLTGNEDWFTIAWNALLEKSTTLSVESGGFISLVPMVQLELYLGQALGKTPAQMSDKGGFYPELFELLRQANANVNNTTASASFNGEQQADLVYHASRAAGLDLTSFFERWGFLRPADNVQFFNTYNNAFNITLTQQKAEEVRSRIKTLGLPKPNVAFEYITSRNIELFRTPRAVVPGSSSRNGQDLRFDNWQNVVAWEVVDANGKLIYTSTGWKDTFATTQAGFTLPSTIPWIPGYQVRAIAANGTRTVVPVS